MIIFNYAFFRDRKKIRRMRITSALNLFIITMNLWVLGFLLEQFFPIEFKEMLFTKIKSSSACLIGPLWLSLAIKYSLSEKVWERNRWAVYFIFIIPLVLIVGIFADSSHRLFYGSLRNGYGNGIFFYAMIAYSITTVVSGVLLISSKLFETRSPDRYKLIFIISIFVVTPLIGRGFEILKLVPIGHPIPALMTCVGSIAIVVGTTRYALLRWMPFSIAEVVESIPTGIVVIDKEGKLVTLNPAAMMMLDMVPGDPVPDIVDEIAEEFAGAPPGPERTFDIVFKFKTLRFQRTSVNRPEEALDGMVLSITDVTGEQLYKDAQMDFVSSVSDELKPHFNTMMASLEKIENAATVSNADNIQAFSELRSARLRLAQLAEQLELFTKLETGQYIPKKTEMDLVPTARTALSRMKEAHAGEGCRLDIEMPPHMFIKTDPLLFSTLVESLVGGVARYCESNHVVFKIYTNEDGVVVDASCYTTSYTAATLKTAQSIPNSPAELSAQLLISDTRSLGVAICKAATSLAGGRFTVDEAVKNELHFTAILPV